MRLVEALQPLYNVLPSIRPPKESQALKTKLYWTAFVLVLYYIMGRIQLAGIDLSKSAGGQLQGLQVVLASELGTLITVGIGPIVLASIILQLLVGGKFLNINLQDPKDRVMFQALQKVLAIILAFVEGFIYVSAGLIVPLPGMMLFTVLQIALGSIFLLYMDEIISKYGIGSGISLFIAANVGASFFWQIFMPPAVSLIQPSGGILFQFIESLGTGINFLILIPILMAIIIFLVIVFAEGMFVNIPIAMGAKGLGGRYPVKLLYVSNMPVILAVALFANIRIWALVTEKIPIIGNIFGAIQWATQSPFNLFGDILLRISGEGIVQGLMVASPAILQGLVYLGVLIVTCVVFGKFWVELGGQSTEDVAKQLENSGMYIPGFRRDERIIKKILDKYIPVITILGSIFVGLLAGIGDMALGGLSSGTGILLAVGIVYRLYEEIAKQQVMGNSALLSKLMGKQKA
ncbi:MAG: preprotein translocase subunit SecY [Candidatus Diapherotrites archaeon]|nr:preprotein translocase subunit SecY [Candidatus Diapherotrites archaeon]